MNKYPTSSFKNSSNIILKLKIKEEIKNTKKTEYCTKLKWVTTREAPEKESSKSVYAVEGCEVTNIKK